MGRRKLGLALLVPALALSLQQAYTAGNQVSASTAGAGAATVTGATMLGISWTYVDSVASGFTVTLKGDQLLKTVTASYGGGGSLTCTTPLLNLDKNTDVTCTGTAPRRGTPVVQVTVS